MILIYIVWALRGAPSTPSEIDYDRVISAL